MPDESVSTDKIAIRLGKVDEGITTSKVKVALTGFDGVPFHAVLGSELIELSLDDGRILRVGEKRRVGASTEVQLSLGFNARSQAASSASATCGRRGGSRSASYSV